MPARLAYLLRDSGGHCHTVIAHSLRGAVKVWSAQNPRYVGVVEVKERGGGAWQAFKIS